jgi:hypothetical protein
MIVCQIRKEGSIQGGKGSYIGGCYLKNLKIQKTIEFIG